MIPRIPNTKAHWWGAMCVIVGAKLCSEKLCDVVYYMELITTKSLKWLMVWGVYIYATKKRLRWRWRWQGKSFAFRTLGFELFNKQTYWWGGKASYIMGVFGKQLHYKLFHLLAARSNTWDIYQFFF